MHAPIERRAVCGRPNAFPTPADLWPRRPHLLGQKPPTITLCLYQALQGGDLTIRELAAIAWPDPEARERKRPETLAVLLNRLDWRLEPFGLAIAQIGRGYRKRTYRLVRI